MYMDITTPANRQASYALGYLGHNLGFAVGPLIGSFLFHAAPGWLFWGNALAQILAMILVVTLVPESKPSKEHLEESKVTASTEKAVEGSTLSALRARPLLIAFVAIGILTGFVYAQHRFSLPIQLAGLFGADSGAKLYGSIMTFNAVLVILFSAPLIAFLKRFAPVTNVALAAALYALGFGLCAFIRSPLLFFLSTLLWTTGEIIEATNSQVYVSNHTPMSHRGRFAAILPIIGGSGWALSSPIGGRLLEWGGSRLLWISTAIAALLACGLLILLGKKEPSGKNETAAE